MADDRNPTSNPLPPPPRRDGRKRNSVSFSNLSNTDFRKMVLETPRREEKEAKKEKPKSSYNKHRDSGDHSKGGRKPKVKPKGADEEEEEEEEKKAFYRDRAEERRKDLNLDYADPVTELGGLNAVAPPGMTDISIGDAYRMSIENSKYLGGDLEHTHLVKGLDYALLQKVRSEQVHKTNGKEEQDEEEARDKEQEAMVFRTPLAKTVYQQLVRPQQRSKVNDLFLPGRTQYIFDMEDSSHEIPTTVQRSKDDCLPTEEAVTVSVDSGVLERISRIMAYLRLGTTGKAQKKKKKKEKDPAEKLTIAGVVPLVGDDTIVTETDTVDLKESIVVKAMATAPGRNDEDDIFVGAGVDYVPEIVPKGSVTVKAGEEGASKKNYFGDPIELDEPPPPPPGMEDSMAPVQGPTAPPPGPTYPPESGWQPYPEADSDLGDAHPCPYPSTDHLYPADGDSVSPHPLVDSVPSSRKDPKAMTQEEKDLGFSSVLRRDDLRLVGKKETDVRERDPHFVSESYAECYPDYTGFTHDIAESDDEDLSKMDQGAKVKGRLHEWDFRSEEEWSEYNESKEAMPKAAYQFGVKASDGRRSRKQMDKEQKLSRELNQINKINDRKKPREEGIDHDLPGLGRGKKQKILS